MVRWAVSSFLILVLAGCSATAPKPPAGHTAAVATTPKALPRLSAPRKPHKTVPINHTQITQALYAQHQRWQGAPYRLGGNSLQGVDCSGFVKATFAERFNQALPRTTWQQAQVGAPVERFEIKPGDLVFFRTAEKVRHVGIYLENGRFLHASTSRGVMISNLNNPYWASVYWMSRRVDW